jgi:hypothetical protein
LPGAAGAAEAGAALAASGWAGASAAPADMANAPSRAAIYTDLFILIDPNRENRFPHLLTPLPSIRCSIFSDEKPHLTGTNMATIVPAIHATKIPLKKTQVVVLKRYFSLPYSHEKITYQFISMTSSIG